MQFLMRVAQGIPSCVHYKRRFIISRVTIIRLTECSVWVTTTTGWHAERESSLGKSNDFGMHSTIL